MFESSFTEFVLILVIGLLILGPERLPKVAAQIGRWVARARRTANQLRMQLEREVALDDLKRAQEKKPRPKPRPQQSAETGDGSAAEGAKPGESTSTSIEPRASMPQSAQSPLGTSDAPPPGVPGDRPTSASADSTARPAPQETIAATEDETAVR